MNIEIKNKIIEIQNNWAKGIIAIGNLTDNRDECVKVAKNFVDTFYAYHFTPVIFKPTMASEIQFRATAEGALSYFVGGNPDYPEDKGFALNPWKKILFDNESFLLDYNIAIASGNYILTDYNANEIKVEYTMGFVPDRNGTLKINLHHSSFPYAKK